MFVRRVKGYGKEYMHVVESIWNGGMPIARILWPLGRYEEKTFLRVKMAISDWRRLKNLNQIQKENADSSGPLQGKSYFMQYKVKKRKY